MHEALRVISLALPGLSDRLKFEPFQPGVESAWIYGKDGSGPGAALLRYEPGATIPAHRHGGYEHILVLEGAQQDERGRYPAGTLIVNEPGTQHKVSSPDGCLVLVIWEKRVTFLE
jgi:anti-sigma factor ChrR (cupin superfamily)